VRVSVLASGSSGNATVVEANGHCVLVDCGISYRQLGQRMRAVGLEPGRIEAVLVSHEHSDHVQGLEVFLGRHPVPVLTTAGTAAALRGVAAAEPLTSGREWRIGGLSVLPVATSHDAREPIGFVLEHGGTRVGLVTDTGVITELLVERLAGCHALLLEANHDVDMLRIGPYPWPLKQRILSRTGHLANAQARAALERVVHDGLEVIVAMHLSRENNSPVLVRREIEAVLAGSRVRLEVAAQDEPLQVALAGTARPLTQPSLFGDGDRAG
jgi:phosphoribosyl 1,2-cyclic phosphodiesterase